MLAAVTRLLAGLRLWRRYIRPPDPAAGQRPGGLALGYAPAAEAHPATAAFWAALGGGDRAARAGVIDQLEAAVVEQPDQEELHLLLGLADLWTLAEPLPGEEAPAAQLPAALGARDHLRRAYELCPTDHPIAAWLRPVPVPFPPPLHPSPPH